MKYDQLPQKTHGDGQRTPVAPGCKKGSKIPNVNETAQSIYTIEETRRES